MSGASVGLSRHHNHATSSADSSNAPPRGRYTLPMATGIVAASPAWSLRLITEFDAADQEAKELLGGLSPEQLNWQPMPGAWSVGQCLEHLCITNELYVPAIHASLTGKSVCAVQEITPGWFARWFI